MSDFKTEEEIARLVAHGENTLKTMKRISAWCLHARLERTGGVGLVEAMYNVPIGHMGVRCVHAPAGGLMCWELTDAFLDHYESHCKTCTLRKPGVGADMQPVIDRHEQGKEQQERERIERETAEAKELADRRTQRSEVFGADNPIHSDICELLDKIDVDGARDLSEKLVEFARLAPDAFSPKIIDYLETLVENDVYRLARVAGDMLLNLPDYPQEKRIRIAVLNCNYGMSDNVAHVLETSADNIENRQVDQLLDPLAYRAVPSRYAFSSQSEPNPTTLKAVITAHPESVAQSITRRLDGRPRDVQSAARLIWVATELDSDITRPFQRDIISKLLRNHLLLPGLSEDRGGDEGVSVLRDAAAALFDADPEACDSLVQSLCVNASQEVTNEAASLYRKILRDNLQWGAPLVEPTRAKQIAFKRLLWMAVSNPESGRDNRAVDAFHYVSKALLSVAASEIDSLLGAAASLGQAYEQARQPPVLETPATGFEAIEQNHRLSSIENLQSALVDWAFAAAQQAGAGKVREMLSFYDALPESDTLMRPAIVKHLTGLISDTETLNLVLPHLYKAMTDSNALIRGHAARAVGEAKHEIQQDFPTLIFEVYLVLLTDPIIFVHKSAVRSLRTYNFPTELKPRLSSALVNLIFAYARGKDDDDFLVECMRLYTRSFLTDSDLAGKPGKVLVDIINELDPHAAFSAVKDLHFSLRNAEGFGRLLGNLFNSDWAPDLLHPELIKALFELPEEGVREAVDALDETARRIAPRHILRAEPFISLLCKAGEFERAKHLCSDLLETLDETKEHESAKARLETFRQILNFEALAQKNTAAVQSAQARWTSHLAHLDKLKEDADAERRRLPFLHR